MKYAVAVTSIFAMAVIGVVVYELSTGNMAIQAKTEHQSDNNKSSNYSAKLVLIKANDGAQQTFIVTQEQFTGIQSSIVSSTGTNSTVNATLDNIANFLVAHSGPPSTYNPHGLTNSQLP
jgi:hypothetical protein